VQAVVPSPTADDGPAGRGRAQGAEMKLVVHSAKIAPMTVHDKVEKPDPNGNRQQRRAWKKKVRKSTK